MEQIAELGPLNEPRAHLDGCILPKDYSLPPLASVRAEAVLSQATAREIRKRPQDLEDVAFLFPPGSPAHNESLPMHVKLPLIFNSLFPNLFAFSYAVRDTDVADDIIEDCIWALSVFIRLIEEGTETVLRAVGHIKDNNDYRFSKYATLQNARMKIVFHLLRVERAEEAIPYGRAAIYEQCSRVDEVWLRTPAPFEIYGEALVLARTDDNEAVKMLRRAMHGVEAGSLPADSISLPLLIRTRTFLARALRNIGVDEEAETHEKWLINWWRKNHHLVPGSQMKQLLIPGGPVLEGLGGEAWLQNRKLSSRDEQRTFKACATCRAREPLVILSRCNNCKYTYYCSKKCRRTHWKRHKLGCRERAAKQEEAERISLTDPAGAKCAIDWELWRRADYNVAHFWFVHALGLHRNPQRGRTHIVIKEFEYVPAATNLKHKFRVLTCGVFLIKDVLRDIETAMRLDPGEGQEYVDSLISEVPGEHPRVPFIELALGDGIPVRLGSGGTTIDTIRTLPYDPDWRRIMNVGVPPGPLGLRSGAKDAEHVF
ncbi:hypothetical protein B0H14DRAFT_2729835 [Mycena olivaceomarginata]|nr:hypothetical protein B0H14DRAFT_2729835 [Mycena olivaceomarginata]